MAKHSYWNFQHLGDFEGHLAERHGVPTPRRKDQKKEWDHLLAVQKAEMNDFRGTPTELKVLKLKHADAREAHEAKGRQS